LAEVDTRNRLKLIATKDTISKTIIEINGVSVRINDDIKNRIVVNLVD
jgi:hypothetical protein